MRGMKKEAEMAARKTQAQKPAYEAAKVSCSGYEALNVRKEPSKDAEIIGSLKNGAEVKAMPEADGWRKLEGGGYVVGRFLA